MTAGARAALAAGVGGPAYRALGVDEAQVGLEAANAPAAVAAQLQVAVALVGTLHQQRDGLGLDLHVCCAVGSAALRGARQAASQPPSQVLQRQLVFLGRAPPPRAPFIRPPRPGSAAWTLCGCRPLAGAEATAPTWPNRRPDPCRGRAEHVGAADATRRGCVTRRRGCGPGARVRWPCLGALRSLGASVPRKPDRSLPPGAQGAVGTAIPADSRFGRLCKLFPHKAAPHPF